MKFYWIKTRAIIRKIFPNYIWKLPNKERKVFLTFDDGPTPEITEWVLKELKKHKAKATFFCIGKNIKQNPELFNKIISDNHAIGNHSNNHLNGWKTKTAVYLENVILCQLEITKQLSKNTNQKNTLFRPPYGKIKKAQSKKLKQLGYKIIMWDVLSGDFDTTISPKECLKNVLKNTDSGSIIVFHDSVKAFPNLKHTLPTILQLLKEKGFEFDIIS